MVRRGKAREDRAMWRWWSVVVAACGSGADAPTDAIADADVDSDPYCHYDCFGSLSCVGNEVRYQIHAPVPCTEWTGECPTTVYTCSQGCDVSFESFPTVLWSDGQLSAFCAEAVTVSAGAPCSDPLECLPTRGVDSGGTVVQDYLACDFTMASCTTVPPPDVTSFLMSCAAAAATVPEGESRALYTSDTGTWCLVAWDAIAMAQRHGQTVACVGDWSCPEGATCDDSIAGSPDGLCRPGPRGSPLVDHLPPP
jgi:hypothetical protein